MLKEDFRVAIDIGTTKVCTIIARKRPDHRIEVTGISLVPCEGMNKGLVADATSVTSAVLKSIETASEDAGVNINTVYAGLTGNHVESTNRWSSVPRAQGMRVITDTDLSSAMAASSAIDLSDDRKLLHVIPRSYALDGLHGVRNPLGMHTGQLHVESHVITGSISKIDELENAISDAGVDISSMIIEPLASAHAALTADEREEGAVLIDVGGGTSGIAVYHDGAILHTAVIPVGGYQFSNDLSIAFDIDFDEAEQLKIQHGTAAPELTGMKEEITLNPHSMHQPLIITKREVGQILKERASELFRMIQFKLEEPHLVDIPLDRIVFTGGGAKLEGFLNIAKYIFQRKVRLAKPRGLDGMPPGTDDPAYTAAAGIALWSIRNLPDDSHFERPKSSEPKNLWANPLTLARKWFSKSKPKDKQALEKETASA
ncbi:MAG: cell division protein FtsA [Chloroflexi bacterium]|nr:cell division protein FtsA [Chloroflexota bacterium]